MARGYYSRSTWQLRAESVKHSTATEDLSNSFGLYYLSELCWLLGRTCGLAFDCIYRRGACNVHSRVHVHDNRRDRILPYWGKSSFSFQHMMLIAWF